MVPSTVRTKPSESAAIAGAGAGCGCISAHHAPSKHHNTRQRKPDDALRAQSRQSRTSSANRSQRNQQVGRPKPHPMSDNDSQRKQPRRMKERNSNTGRNMGAVQVGPEFLGSASMVPRILRNIYGRKVIRIAVIPPPSPGETSAETGRQA